VGQPHVPCWSSAPTSHAGQHNPGAPVPLNRISLECCGAQSWPPFLCRHPNKLVRVVLQLFTGAWQCAMLTL
jgi:hypothetical protein